MKGGFRRTIRENISGRGCTLYETERTLCETDARSQNLDAHYLRLGGGTLSCCKTMEVDPQGAKTGTRNSFYRVPGDGLCGGDHGRLVWRQMAGVRKDGAFGKSEN